MKRLLALSLIFLLGLTGCSTATNPSASAPDSAYTPGIYEGTGTGFWGPITVSLELSENAIEKITVTDHRETENIGTLAIEPILQSILDNQSLADVITGASFTSRGVTSAVKNALTEAGVSDTKIHELESAEIKMETPQDTETDVLVVGSGAAGMLAALTACDEGASVILVEKLSLPGGSTKLSGGAVWELGAQETAVYADYSAKDILDLFEEYAGPVNNPSVLLTLAEGTKDSVEYIRSNHFQFRDDYLVTSNQRARPDYRSLSAKGSGAGLAGQLYSFIQERDIDVRFNSRAAELILEDGQSVNGVRIETPSGTYTIKAQKVILATGGYAYNHDMLEAYAPGTYVNNTFSANPGSEGDGHRMGLEAGGVIVGEGVLGITQIDTRPGTEVTLWNPPFIVNQNGERFMAGDEYYPRQQQLITAQPEGLAYAIYDANWHDQETLEKFTEMGYVIKADSLEELAAALNINETELLASVQANNAAVSDNATDAFGTDPDYIFPLDTAPYYGYRRSANIMGTIAGLKVDESMHVLNEEDKPIGNLYAAGELIFGNLFNNTYPMSGTANTLAMSSGRIAAKDAVSSLK